MQFATSIGHCSGASRLEITALKYIVFGIIPNDREAFIQMPNQALKTFEFSGCKSGILYTNLAPQFVPER